jgi:hypothetical protein
MEQKPKIARENETKNGRKYKEVRVLHKAIRIKRERNGKKAVQRIERDT